MARSNPVREHELSEKHLSKILTIAGQGTPASFECTVDGEIAPATASPGPLPIRSGRTVEGTVESDTQRYLFSGELTDVTIINRGGIEAPVVDPEIYVEER